MRIMRMKRMDTNELRTQNRKAFIRRHSQISIIRKFAY